MASQSYMRKDMLVLHCISVGCLGFTRSKLYNESGVRLTWKVSLTKLLVLLSGVWPEEWKTSHVSYPGRWPLGLPSVPWQLQNGQRAVRLWYGAGNTSMFPPFSISRAENLQKSRDTLSEGQPSGVREWVIREEGGQGREGTNRCDVIDLSLICHSKT